LPGIAVDNHGELFDQWGRAIDAGQLTLPLSVTHVDAHFSDQGSQYTSFAFTKRLAAEGIVASMGTVGDALDNAMCESLIGTMKIEKLNRQQWRSVEDLRAAVFERIESWYNRRRRHSSLGYLSPLEFESQHYDGHAITNP
jgi:putative transposase